MVTPDIDNEGENVNDIAIVTLCNKFSPEPVLINQQKFDRYIKTIHFTVTTQLYVCLHTISVYLPLLNSMRIHLNVIINTCKNVFLNIIY